MKTKLFFGLILCLIISSCVKDFYSHPDDNKGILTEKNYVYADDLKRVHLESVIAELKTTLEKIDPIKEEEQYNELSKKIIDTQNTISNIENLRNDVFKRRPPPPPCPSPQSCLDWLRVMYFADTLGESKLILSDLNQNVIAQTDGYFEQLDGLDVPLKYSVLIFENEDYRGEIEIKVIETAGENPQTYIVRSEIR